MSLLRRTEALLRRHLISPNKLLGQNFMIEPLVFDKLTKCVSLNREDVVLDIGAGLGFLTRFLAGRCARVLTIEKDKRLFEVLHEQLDDLSNVEVIEGDLFREQIPAFNKIVSIPPYHISSQLLCWLFNKKLDCAVLVFQKEFANRLVATVGTEDYGWLSVLAYYYTESELLDEIPKSLFYPQPNVESIIVRLTPKQAKPCTVTNEALFAKLLKSLFAERNKKVRNAILPFLRNAIPKTVTEAAKLADTLPFHDKRVRELAPEDLGVLTNALTD